MSKKKAVIFDLDGVISDTQRLHFEVDVEILKRKGIDFPLKGIKKYAGVSDREFFRELVFKKKKFSEKEMEKIIEMKYETLFKKMEGNLKPIKGVIELIKRLKRNSFKLAVASSSPEKAVNFVLSSFKIKKYFDVILSREDVVRAKPDPEIYLKAAKLLKLKPEDCLVIEDSPSGIKAAKLAGMKCIAIATTLKKEQLKRADKIINSFEELSLKEICGI